MYQGVGNDGLAMADRQKKYNTIDTSNIQANMGSQGVNVGSPGISVAGAPSPGIVVGT